MSIDCKETGKIFGMYHVRIPKAVLPMKIVLSEHLLLIKCLMIVPLIICNMKSEDCVSRTILIFNDAYYSVHA